MKTFEVYEREDHKMQAVKLGFSWPAFFFGAIWAFVKGLVAVGFGLIFAGALLRLIDAAAVSADAAILGFVFQMAFCAFVGSRGNDWRRQHLLGKGYRLRSTVTAANVDEAIRAAYPVNTPAMQPASPNALDHSSALPAM